ncbi:MAG: hypothetical protein AB7O87_08755 [Candidatus Nitrosocosmicus sp.]
MKKIGKTLDELLFDSYSLFFLSRNIQFLIDLHSSQNLTGIRERILLFDILNKYCQLIESFAAHITAFEKSNKGNPSSQIIFNHLAWYMVDSVLKDYSIFNTGPEDPPPEINVLFEEKIRYAFGLIHIIDKDRVERNVQLIFDMLIPLFQMYYFHERIYNANKHGHRVFHFYNLDQNENEPVLFLDRMPKTHEDYNIEEGHDRFLIDFVTVSKSLLEKLVLPNIQKFGRMYRMMLENNKFIIKKELGMIRTIDEF